MSLTKDKVAILKAIVADALVNPVAHLGHPPRGMHESRIVATTHLTLDALYITPPTEINGGRHSGLICDLEKDGWIGLTGGNGADRFGNAWLTCDGRLIAAEV
jgi:hypothetical protein